MSRDVRRADEHLYKNVDGIGFPRYQNRTMNIYDQIARNKLKTYLFIAGFMVFAAFVAYILGGATDSGPGFVVIALVLSGAMSVGSFFWSDKIVLAMTGARPADPQRDFDLVTVTENIAIASGLPKPKVYVIDDPAPNAFATGRDPHHAVVAATTGLVQILDRAELEGVIAHELGHVKNYDIRLMAVVTVLAGVVVLMVDMFTRSLWFGGGKRDDERNGSGTMFLIIGLVIAVLAPIFSTIIKLAISRKRELLADATSAYLTRNPGALADALIKISADPHRMRNASNATAHLFFTNPFKKQSGGSWIASLFNTHPPVEERVKLLRTM